ncbi:UDP-GlcNAc:undecaprenyl-phosphate GlcNAc-1-phosphate transferase [Gracilibacillus ureilyticus]|uniref:UDP-GlcNAc:undecaprenyl-phosphate GlcNAc-1-phosphate transferase n=1 Tax=Gracilibacillus ureilyticus TaxID=531814 RepID=A0A1H9UNL3_9BACI|nr:MraY family glycosyltransferase [Gracilibacillus ureilyticus]SES10603.1 UDP-GlcNAc:undecaprenyl-phosphate GlcNAc-1-phosphate transferase [Gracilibacillus ureilyticus]
MGFLALAVTFLVAVVITPLVIKLAIRIGAVDQPNERKVHTKVMPRLGGLAIVFSFFLGFLIFTPNGEQAWPIIVGGLIITIVGFLDDLFQLPAKVKLLGQVMAAVVTVAGGIQMDFIMVPFGDRIEFGYLTIPITIIWIIGITNAVNLIDGLDGLAAGVSSIVLATISGMALMMGNTFVAFVAFLLLGSTLGFLVYNFNPAKIFMGDTGSLFLGYMISVLSIMGLFKNVTFFSIMVPIIVLGVPILDTMLAIIRRAIQRKPLMAPDKYHLHHCLIRLGFSHKETVIFIYALSCLFSAAAIIFTRSTVWGSGITLFLLLILVEIIIEVTGLISEKYRPLLSLVDNMKKRS